ncbi:eIF2A-related protein [Nostoc sp. ChiQUE01b]|uniref:nSTAND1 domain-containing NTPase n=1 Tax=Nostoc sp. ChiQUE01b TaxID=3075376 RepID=UPI002AD2D35F|nr:caspase family protein [Nostoc sp. ChiQUE01b]MDZ8263543.1 caspase family protein [Nostoc sp. ChiQUE01b]
MSKDALVVGINQYNSGLPALRSPANDAESIAQRLSEGDYFRVWRLPEYLHPFENNARRVAQNQEVTFKQLETALEQLFLPKGDNYPDTALFYFSGHGIRKERGLKEGFLATSDTNPDDDKWGLPLQWLRRVLEESPIRKQVIWLDCCYSGELLNFDEANPDHKGKARDRCFITSSREFEESGQDPNSNYSVLTKVLLEGLDPQRQPDGLVNNYRIIDFINQNLKQEKQRPIFFSYGEPIILVDSRGSRTQETNNPLQPDKNPYRGLAAFGSNPEDTQFFYGRTALIDELLEKLWQQNFLAVLGASGSGKSSVVQAGLLNAIQQGQRRDTANWHILPVITPGDDPLASLATAFIKPNDPVGRKPRYISRLKEKGAEFLAELVSEHQQNPVVLVIDQFEEVFTLCKDSQKRQDFFDCLMDVLTLPNESIDVNNTAALRVVITMRADFLGKCLEQDYAGFAENLKNNTATVTPLTKEELEDVIIKPAEVVGLNVENALVQKMIEDVQGSPSSLPLLQYALTELWELWHQDWQQRGTAAGNTLTLTNYVQIGEVKGALEKQADKVYDSLSQQEQGVAKKIFLELTEPGEGTEDTRKRILKNDLINDQHPKELLDPVISQLADARLVVTNTVSNVTTVSETEQPDDTASQAKVVIDIAHEALIRHWKRLRSWINENRDALRTERKLKAAAKDWQDNQENSDYLWPGARLVEANDYYEKYLSLGRLDQITQKFIQGSRDKQKRLENEEKRLRQEKEKQIQSLNQALTKSQLQEKAARVQNLIPTQPLDALLLAVEAVKTNLDWISNSNKDEISVKKPIAIDILANKPGEILGVVQASLYEAAARAIVPNVCEEPQAAINSIAFSYKGEMIISSTLNMAYFWDSSGKTLLKKLPLCKDKNYDVNSIAFCSESRKIAGACSDNIVRVWSFEGEGEPLYTLQEHQKAVKSVAFSPDGKTIVSGSEDKTIRLWNIDGQPIKSRLLGKHKDRVNAVAFSPNGQMIVSGSKDKTIRLWNINGQPIKSRLLGKHDQSVTAVAFSPNGEMIVSGSEDTTVCLWHIERGLEKQLRGHDGWVHSVAFSPNGQMIVSGSEDKTVRLWDIEGRPVGHPLRGHSDRVSAVAFSPDRQMIVSGSYDTKMILWAIINHNPILELSDHKDSVNAVAFSPDGKMIVSGSSDNTLRLWNSNTGESLLHGHKNNVNAVAFSPDGKMIVSGSSDKTLRLWNSQTGEYIRQLDGHEDSVNAVAFSPNGQMIVSGSSDSTIRLWNIQGECIATKVINSRFGCQVFSVAFSPNGKMIATVSSAGNSGGKLCLWNINNNCITKLWCKWRKTSIQCVAFSPNGEIIATGSSDGKLSLWNIKGDDFEGTKPWNAHANDNNDGVKCVAFSPDGQMIVSGGGDKEIRLWDIKGTPIGQAWSQDDIVTSVAFSPNGEWIATGSAYPDETISNKTIYLWRGGWQEWLEICCKRLAPIILKQPCKDMSEYCEICVRYEFWSDKDFAAILKDQGDSLAEDQQKKDAQDKFIKAKEYDPKLDFEPEARAEQLVALSLMEDIPFLARDGQIKDAIQACERIYHTLDPSKIPAYAYANLCWFGSLQTYQDERIVKIACDKAIEFEKSIKLKAYWRRTRGVARALRLKEILTLDERHSNLLREAIEDFDAYIKDKNIHDNDEKQQCQRWIDVLEVGENPFTETEINDLLIYTYNKVIGTVTNEEE